MSLWNGLSIFFVQIWVSNFNSFGDTKVANAIPYD